MASCYEDPLGSGKGSPSWHEWWRSHGGRRLGRPLWRHGGWLEEASRLWLNSEATGSSIDAYCVDLVGGGEGSCRREGRTVDNRMISEARFSYRQAAIRHDTSFIRDYHFFLRDSEAFADNNQNELPTIYSAVWRS